MNKKEFIRWQIKEWLPLFIGYGVITAIFYWISSYFSFDVYSVGLESGATIPVYVIAAFTFFATAFIPLAIFSYQTNRTRADFYDQIPFKNKELRRIRIWIALIGILAIFTVVFWIGVLLSFLHQVVYNSQAYRVYVQNNANATQFEPYYFNFVYYLPLFFLLVLGITAHYFTSVFLMSLGNRVWDCILLFAIGELLLNFVIQAVLFPIYVGVFEVSSASTLRHFEDYMRLSFGFVYYLSAFVNFFGGNIVKIDSSSYSPALYENAAQTAVFYINVVAYLLIGVICAWLMLFQKKDPAGELAGRPGPRNRLIAWLPHIMMLALGFVVTGATQLAVYGDVLIVIFIFILALWAVLYFVLLFASRSTIRFSKQDWIRVAVVAGIVFVMCLSAGITYGVLK